jgi:hypothetical protein
VRGRLVSGIEHPLTMGPDGRGFPAMNHGGGPQSPAGGAVLFVIPGEERRAERAAVLDAAEAIREVGALVL